jgi:Ca-activated chloride channel homolog
VFEHPFALLGLLAVPLALWLRARGWGRPAAVRFPEAASVAAAFGGGRRPGAGWGEVLRLAAVGVLVVAAARPTWEVSEHSLVSSGLDIILAVDMSGSMSARDFEPLDRLQAAKEVLREFITSERNNRLGLVAFAARAYTVCPLTLDDTVLLRLLDHLEVGMTTDGTAIGMAIAAGLNRLKDSSAKAKAIILLTDGRNNAGALDPDTAAQLAAALGVRLYTIGMGRPGGGAIYVKDPVRGETVLLNEDGSVHQERLDEDMLRRLAAATSGRYFRATDKTSLKSIYTEIGAMERTRLRSKTFRTREDVGHYLLLLAGLLVLLERVLAQTVERRVPA